jgi:hypothetical protein
VMSVDKIGYIKWYVYRSLLPKMKAILYSLAATCTLIIISYVSFRYGLVVRIAGSHPAGPGSIPGNGKLFFCYYKTNLIHTILKLI